MLQLSTLWKRQMLSLGLFFFEEHYRMGTPYGVIFDILIRGQHRVLQVTIRAV